MGVQGITYLVSKLLHCYRLLFRPVFFNHLHNIIDFLSYPVSTIEHSMVGPGEKLFKIKVLRWLENAILIKFLANIVQIIPLTIRFSTIVQE